MGAGMSAKHTPGPWIVDDVEGTIAIAADADGEVLAYLARPHQQTNARGPEETAANARLAAASPDLLEAAQIALDGLRAILPELHRLRGFKHIDIEEHSDEVIALRKAIAKATGSAA
jgi:hypothetical protein